MKWSFILRKIAKLLTPCALAFLCINILCFGYNRDAEWLERAGGATSGIYVPFHYIVKSDEGLAITTVDQNGYLNPSANLAEKYIICYGNSQTNGVNVGYGNRYADRLNDFLTDYEDDIRRVYVVAKGGNSVADLIKGFKALTIEFPNSEAIVLQMYEMDSPDEMISAYEEQVLYKDEYSAECLKKTRSGNNKIIGAIKEWLPAVAYLANVQIPLLFKADENPFFQAGNIIVDLEKENSPNITYLSDDEEKKVVDKYCEVLEGLNKEYDGRIIFLYEPYVQIDKNGEMSIVYDPYYTMFDQACSLTGTTLCNVGQDFINAYCQDYTVAYGFWNTSIGTGHLNSNGHRIIAIRLYEEYLRNLK